MTDRPRVRYHSRMRNALRAGRAGSSVSSVVPLVARIAYWCVVAWIAWTVTGDPSIADLFHTAGR